MLDHSQITKIRNSFAVITKIRNNLIDQTERFGIEEPLILHKPEVGLVLQFPRLHFHLKTTTVSQTNLNIVCYHHFDWLWETANQLFDIWSNWSISQSIWQIISLSNKQALQFNLPWYVNDMNKSLRKYLPIYLIQVPQKSITLWHSRLKSYAPSRSYLNVSRIKYLWS